MSVARRLSAALAAAILLAQPALAQQLGGSLGYRLVKAVKDDDTTEFDKLTASNKGQLNSAVLDYVSDGQGAVHIAAQAGKLRYLQNLLYYGANPNLLNGDGETPLIVAVVAGQAGAIDLLLRGRAQIDYASRRGETPLIKAVQLHRLELVELLLQRGANPDKADFTGQSARAYAAADDRYPAIAKVVAAAPKRATRAVAGPKLN